MTATSLRQPLSGLRVIDASMGAVGPWAGTLLGAMGAQVMKLESPQGDFIRNVMPSKKGLGTTYISMNFNKRGAVLDLKKPEERQVIHRLAADTDVFIENFRPGIAERLGIGYGDLSTINPRIVYASASGFGRSGPLVGVGATDPHLQAFTGACSVNGEAGGKRQRWRWYGHFDCTTALCLMNGILSALYERHRTGRGKWVQTTMVEAALDLQRVRISEHLSGGSPEPMGSAVTYLVPDQAFRAKDQPFALTVSSRREWRDFCMAIDRPDLHDDPRFRRNPDRLVHRQALVALLAEIFAERPAQYWLDVLSAAQVPCALFTTYETFRHDQRYRRENLIDSFDTVQWGKIDYSGVPWRFDKTPCSFTPGTPPGADTALFTEGRWPSASPHPTAND